MIADPKLFFRGVALFVSFIVVLVLLFLPLFDGQSALKRLDALYNSIAKGSADFLQDLEKQASDFNSQRISVNLVSQNEDEAKALARLFGESGATAEVTGRRVKVNGDLGKILASCLQDAKHMFENRGREVETRYGYDEKMALFHWWKALNAMEKALQKQAKYPTAEVTAAVVKKGVECAYNFYGIEYLRIADQIWIVLLSLVFYIVYTTWYGFALLYMFEGYGLKLSH